jgi:acetoacetate decarboxylase
MSPCENTARKPLVKYEFIRMPDRRPSGTSYERAFLLSRKVAHERNEPEANKV